MGGCRQLSVCSASAEKEHKEHDVKRIQGTLLSSLLTSPLPSPPPLSSSSPLLSHSTAAKYGRESHAARAGVERAVCGCVCCVCVCVCVGVCVCVCVCVYLF